VDSVFASLENIPQKFFVHHEVPTRIGNRYEFVYPYDTFKARDGWVVIGVANDPMWKNFTKTIKMTSIADDERFTSNARRVQNHVTLKSLIEKWTTNHNVRDIVHLLTEHGIPSCPIYSIRDIVEDQHIVMARNMVIDYHQPRVGKVKLLGCPIKMSKTNPTPKGAAPALGENTEEVLQELLGLNKVEVDSLRRKGVL
jgi:formyl-CoA transferase